MSSRTIGISFLFGVAVLFFGTSEVFAATNINPATNEHWAWNDIVGWIDFYQGGSSDVWVASNATTTGYASSSAGDISLDCATTRNGPICAQSNYGVYNDGSGNLSGWGWSDQYGWISFWCRNHDPACTPNYRVVIDGGSGHFSGWAWNDIIGWISFNCADLGSNYCQSVSDYKVATSWRANSTSGYLDSSTFDTGITSGAQLNSVIWFGSQPPGTSVGFQFAVSNNSGGPWDFGGPDGTPGTYYMADRGVSKQLDYSVHGNKRYFRYRVTLFSDQAQSVSPRIDDIFINWSP